MSDAHEPLDRDPAVLFATEDGRRLPSHDPVTGLPSRALLLEHLHLAVARARQEDQRVVVLHAGLDGLDLVGAGLGRRAHDEVVREIAGRVRADLPATAIVASVGDGEVAVVLADVEGDPIATAERAAGRVIVAAGAPLEVEGERFELRTRVGVSVLPGDAADEEALLRHADAAMRQARREEGVHVLHYEGGTSDALERLVITARLRRAVERDELLLHFQPIVRIATGEIAGVEALLRWEDPGRGLVPPLDFIPAAEYSGLIEPIGRWVVEACCRQAAAWRDAGLAVPVSLNVSPRQFRDEGFAEHLAAQLTGHDLDPSLLVAEITESVAMRDPTCVEPVLARLRELGVRVAIDDFGTGHSSLARLRDIDVDLLKIDRGFLQDVGPGDGRGARLVGAALALVEALELTAVAEGVETEEQRAFLVAHGCGLAQGFLLARPMPVAEVTELLRASDLVPLTA